MAGFQISGLGQAPLAATATSLCSEAATPSAVGGREAETRQARRREEGEEEKDLSGAAPQPAETATSGEKAPTSQTGEIGLTDAAAVMARSTIVEKSPSLCSEAAAMSLIGQHKDGSRRERENEPPDTATNGDKAPIGETGEIVLTDAAAATSPSPSITHALEDAIGGLEDFQDMSASPPAQSPPDAEVQADEPPEWEVDSSPYQSPADSSTSDSSDAGSDDDEASLLGVEDTARLLMEMEGGSEDGTGKADRAGSNAHLRTKNELAEEAVVRPDVTITADMKLEELGAVDQVVDKVILIKAATPGEYQVLDTGSVVCDARRIVLGSIAETFGKVVQPLYTVRFNSADEIQALGLAPGSTVYYAVDHAVYVFTQPLKKLKGSDASNIYDEEVAADEMDFSDDEEEAAHRRALKQQTAKAKQKTAAPGATRDGGGKAPHPLRREVKLADGGDGGATALNYDNDGPYKPLARPLDYGYGHGRGSSAEPRNKDPAPHHRDAPQLGYMPQPSGSTAGTRMPPVLFMPQAAPPTQGRQVPQPSGPAAGTGMPPIVPFMPHAVPPTPGGFPVPPPPPSSGWLPQLPRQGSAASAGFSVLAPPPPPPPPLPSGWGAPAAGGRGGGGYIDPALIAALMQQLQERGQGGAPQWPPGQQQ